MSTLTDALRAAAMIGPYFALETEPAGDGWRPLSELRDDPAVLRTRVEQARRTLAHNAGADLDAVEHRVAASIYFLGVAARLVSAPVAMAALAGVVPVLTMDTVCWHPDGSPLPLALIGPAAHQVGAAEELATLLFDDVITPCVAPLADAVQYEFRLSRQVVWGNVASALAGAAAMISAVRPAAIEQTSPLLERLLGMGQLAGAGMSLPGTSAAGPRFRRNNCCLYYRIPGGGMCGDCVLRVTPDAPPSATSSALR